MTEKTDPPVAVPWHALPIDETYERLSTGSRGLSSEEAARRQKQYGKNVLPAARPPALLRSSSTSLKAP